MGSGICYEVSAALDAMVKLASKRSQELISLSYHLTGTHTSLTSFNKINLVNLTRHIFQFLIMFIFLLGILDYLEGFNVESLHKVHAYFF